MTFIPYEQYNTANRLGQAQEGSNATLRFHDELYPGPNKQTAKSAEISSSNDSQPSAVVMPADVKRLLERDFKIFDRDGSGRISDKEINQSLQDGRLSFEDQQLAAALKALSQDLHVNSPRSGISLDDVAKFDKMQKEVSAKTNSDSPLFSDPDLTREAVHQYRNQHFSAWNNFNPFHSPSSEEIVLSASAAMASVRREANQSLYENEQHPLACIKPEAIHQGQSGDCYFLSALASMSATKQGKQSILNMIDDNKDGTYTVKFPSAPDEPITVKAPTPAEMATYQGSSGHGTWAAVLEKAYGDYCNKHFWRRTPLNPFPSDEAQKGTDGGSLFHAGLRVLTGKGVDADYNITTSLDTMDRKLSEAFAQGHPVTAYTNVPVWKTFSRNDIPLGHEYGVLNYNQATRMITILNPWGFQEPEDANGKPLDGKDDGIFTISLSDFNKKFTGLAYSK
jgi:hypothetical protein